MSNHTLEPGLSFLIRAKNEEKNVWICLQTLTEALEGIPNIEIVFVENKSDDETYVLAEQFVKYFHSPTTTIQLHKFEKEVCKIGDNRNTDHASIASYYNWCLDKTTKYNVIKWDADFVTHKENLREMIQSYQLNTREDQFALWFSGTTIFEHKGVYFEKVNSYYDEFRVFSKKHGFRWVDHGNVCEIPQVRGTQIRYKEPVFFELKRTSLNEFATRLVHIDRRDTEDSEILERLRKGETLVKNGKSLVTSTSYYLFCNE
jgi:glycosyltransferase involved in cell wall biosynthesis